MDIIKINSISELEKIKIRFNKKTEIHYTSDNLTYCFLVRLKRFTSKLLVLSNGAIDPKRSKPPVYMRHKWSDDFDASHIFLDDPTIHKDKLRIGWGQGIKEEFALEIYSEIIKTLSKRLEIKDNDVYYYGSSAGGFMSMVLSAMHSNSNAIVNNPQTDVKNYAESASKPLIEKIYGSIEYAYENYAHRLDVIEAFKYYDYTPNILYVQNRLCGPDMKKHYFPYMQKFTKSKLNLQQTKTLLYHNKKAGHNPLGQEDTVKLINDTMNVKRSYKLKLF